MVVIISIFIPTLLEMSFKELSKFISIIALHYWKGTTLDILSRCKCDRIIKMDTDVGVTAGVVMSLVKMKPNNFSI